MKRIAVFGNSGSGKSTLAKALAEREGLAHLDLDTVAWAPSLPPTRMDLDQSKALIEAFTDAHQTWVIEGCYADLLDMILPITTEIIFLNLPVETCMENARQRPWEPHKYDSKEAQDANLDMLINWIADYDIREDTFSRTTHMALYEGYKGKKTMHRDNGR